MNKIGYVELGLLGLYGRGSTQVLFHVQNLAVKFIGRGKFVVIQIKLFKMLYVL